MKRAALMVVLLVLACAGCRSARGKHRDYRSIDRASLAFLWDTARQSRTLRRESLAADFHDPARRASNRRIRKEGRRFAWHATFDYTWEEGRAAWEGVKEELRTSRRDFWDNVRFGLLDSGK